MNLTKYFMEVNPNSLSRMSDNELCKKLDIARKNIEKWNKREEDIQLERSLRIVRRGDIDNA